MTKILLDCVLTATDPVKCSTNIQYLRFVQQTLETRPDVFFYWLIPDWAPIEAYPQHERIRYARVPQHRDRTKEYLTLSRELDNAVGFNGDMWDFDVLLTMRTGMLPVMKMLATSPRNHRLGWIRQIWLIEAMVLLSFKKTVLTFDAEAQDLFTLNGYLTADKVFLTSHIDKLPILQRAREMLTPSRVREIDQKIVPVGYGLFHDISLKTPDQFPDPDNGKPFCIAHAGRLEKANRIEEINDLMVNNFVMQGDKVKLLVCTVSDGRRTFDKHVVDIKHASREEFWQLCKTDMHVIVNMAVEGGSSMALLEPMMMGVPAIVSPRKAYEAAWGKGYPYIADTVTQAYAMLKMFYEDYAGMYAKWAEWHQTTFKALMAERMDQGSIYAQLDRAIEEFALTEFRIRKECEARAGNAFVKDAIEYVGDAKELVMADVVNSLIQNKKMMPFMADKLKPGDRDKRGLVWSTDFNELRRYLCVFHGWADASIQVGHLKKVA